MQKERTSQRPSDGKPGHAANRSQSHHGRPIWPIPIERRTFLKNRTIGVVDSGLGGLTVLKELVRLQPDNHYLYFGDAGHAPYGGRPIPEMKRLAYRMVSFVAQQPLDALVLACNTMSSSLIEDFRRDLHLPVIGTIQAGARAAMEAYEASPHPKTQDHISWDIGITGTEITIRSGAFHRALFALNPDFHLVDCPCPSIVPAVETATFNEARYRQAVEKDLAAWQKDPPPIVILGCTHFPLVSKQITDFLGHDVRLIDPALCMVEDLVRALSERKACAAEVGGQAAGTEMAEAGARALASRERAPAGAESVGSEALAAAAGAGTTQGAPADLVEAEPTQPSCHFYTTGDVQIMEEMARRLLGRHLQGLDCHFEAVALEED